MGNGKVTQDPAKQKAAKAATPLNDDQLDRVAGGARLASGKPIIIIGG